MAKRLVTGIKPTGDIHIGNYFGVMKPLIDLQNSYEGFVFIADLHALNQVHDAALLKTLTQEIITAYLAVGLNPDKFVLFRQSEVPAHSELTVMLNSITSMGLLERAHAYKDSLAKDKAPNVGLFDYPVLMAADILLYKADIVPVGNDQQQHVEIMTDIAQRFNHLFGPTLKITEGLISSETGIIKGLDGRKMSKSYNNVIGLFDTPEVIQKKVSTIVTDSAGPSDPKNPDTCNIFYFHQLFGGDHVEDIKQRYLQGTITYKESKDILAETIIKFTQPMRERKAELEQRPEYIANILEKGRVSANEVANQTLAEAKKAVGLY